MKSYDIMLHGIKVSCLQVPRAHLYGRLRPHVAGNGHRPWHQHPGARSRHECERLGSIAFFHRGLEVGLFLGHQVVEALQKTLLRDLLRRQKLLRKQKMDTKQEVHRFIEHIVHEPLASASSGTSYL